MPLQPTCGAPRKSGCPYCVLYILYHIFVHLLFVRFIRHNDGVRTMPKGTATRRKLREMAGKVDKLQAALATAVHTPPPRAQSRTPVPRRWDWNCPCGYYVYEGKSQCPRCGGARARGLDCVGVRHRRAVEGTVQEAGPPRAAPNLLSGTPQSRVMQQQRPQQRQQQQQLQQWQQPQRQQQQQLQQQQLPSRSLLAPQQRQVPQAPPPRIQPQKSWLQVAQDGAAVANQGSQSSACGAQLNASAVLPVGLQLQPTVTEIVSSAAPVVSHDIFSQDDANQMEGELEAVEDDPAATVAELDETVTDPRRIFRRITGVRRAIERRTGRVERAKGEVARQQAVLEDAKLELEAKTAALAQEEAGLQSFQDTHAQLTKRYAELSAAVADQHRAVNNAAPNIAEQNQQRLWAIASQLRDIGADPRIEQSINMLHSLFHDLGAAAASAGSGGMPLGASMPTPAVVDPAPMSAAAPAAPVPAAAVPVVGLGASQPVQPFIQHTAVGISTQIPTPCGRCWSFACRCGPAHPPHPTAAPSAPASADIEVDLERGKKRSCSEASLPGRASGGQQTQGAILVDSCGNPAAPAEADAEAAAEAKLSDEGVATGLQQESLQGDGATLCQAAVDEGPGSLAVDSSAAKSGLHDRTDNGGTSNEEEKEKSRKSFGALVRETCSTRAYPY